MGGGRWDDISRSAYRSVTKKRSTLNRNQIFKRAETRTDFNPKNISMRESRDSEDNPKSNAIIVGLDVSGTMGYIAEHIAKEGLGTLAESIIDTKPVSDPHIMFLAIGDAVANDINPLQATQFEADIRISEQITDLYLEGGGGGNGFESYDLAWLLASEKTSIDCYEKRKDKGYLFTVGDEEFPTSPDRRKLKTLGFSLETEITSIQSLTRAQEKYNVFHIVVEEGSYAKRDLNRVLISWEPHLKKKVIRLSNYKHISQVITSVIHVNEGKDPNSVISMWEDDDVKNTVTHALGLTLGE